MSNNTLRSLPPIWADFEDTLKALLQTQPADNVKGSRAVNEKAKPKRKRSSARQPR